MVAIKIIVVIVYAAIMAGVMWAMRSIMEMLPFTVLTIGVVGFMSFAFGAVFGEWSTRRSIIAGRWSPDVETQRLPLGRDSGTRPVSRVQNLRDDITDL